MPAAAEPIFRKERRFTMAAILLNSAIIASLLAGQAADVVSELREMQQQILRALLANDREAYAAMLAPEWRVTYVDGRVQSRAEVLGEVFAGPQPLLKAGRVDNVEVQVVGPDLAVVTGRTEATPQTGATVKLRFVDIAVRRDGRWMITASFATFTP
jgi:uncharacterized protein (TIGR02246 family)